MPDKQPLQHCDRTQPHSGHQFMRGRSVYRCPGVGFAGPYDKVWTRLCEIRNLREGWLDGAGKAVREDVVRAAGKLAEALPSGLHPLSIFPTEPGGIEIEWRDQTGTHSITVNPDQTLFLLSDDPADTKPTTSEADAGAAALLAAANWFDRYDTDAAGHLRRMATDISKGADRA